jgi:hypothetical protein
MIHIEQSAGRLVFIRAASPLTSQEVDVFAQQALEILLSGGHKIVFTDLRALRVLKSEYADRLAALMQVDLPCLQRSAFLVAPESALVELQFDRLVKTCGAPSRRLFREPAAALEWLAPALTQVEQDALAAGFDQPQARAHAAAARREAHAAEAFQPSR